MMQALPKDSFFVYGCPVIPTPLVERSVPIKLLLCFSQKSVAFIYMIQYLDFLFHSIYQRAFSFTNTTLLRLP